MTILVFSDSHGRVGPMMDLIREHRPERVFHLGDVSRDLDFITSEWPELPIESVPGNCDGWTGRPLELIVEVRGFHFLLCHGHSRGVKLGTAGLLEEAKRQGVDAALFGHTHRPFCECVDGIWLFNPGSVGMGEHQEYGIITIENGQLKCTLAQGR